MYDSRHVANELIRRSRERNQTLTHMQIQKLIYFAHARMLSIHSEPLINQEFEAWSYGPVVPDLYQSLKRHGSDPVRQEIPMRTPVGLNTRERDLVDHIFNRYGSLSASQLSELTHGEGTPWSNAVGGHQDEQRLSNEAIKQYHVEQWRSEARETLERISRIPEIREKVLEGIGQIERGEYVSMTSDELAEKIASRAASRS